MVEMNLFVRSQDSCYLYVDCARTKNEDLQI